MIGYDSLYIGEVCWQKKSRSFHYENASFKVDSLDFLFQLTILD
jgi:hypothetical protein